MRASSCTATLLVSAMALLAACGGGETSSSSGTSNSGGSGATGGGGATSGGSTTGGGTASGGSGGTGGIAAVCGNGQTESGEECDDGSANADDAACTAACQKASCGDGLVQTGIEQCDQGAANADDAACTLACKKATCGDGLLRAGVEQCDQGAANADDAACTKACKDAACGDGLVQAGVEQCDLGAQNADTGACLSSCLDATCGDGLVWAGTEQCDDGAANADTAACSSMCKDAVCGDGLVWGGVEPCDDANGDDGDGCKADCTPFGLVLWTRTYPGSDGANSPTFNGVAADASGAAVVIGSENGPNGNLDIVVQKYDAAGTLGWTRHYNGAINGSDGGAAVAVDAAGDVLAAGWEGQPLHTDMFLGKLAGATGLPVWTQTYDADGVAGDYDEIDGIALGPAGEIFVTGTAGLPATGQDVLTARIDPVSHAMLWSDIVDGPGPGNDLGGGIAVDPSGSPIVAGTLYQVATGLDIWARKYSAAGAPQWTHPVPGVSTNIDFGRAAATDSAGNVVIAGVQYITVANADLWLRKLTPAGTIVWTQTFASFGNGYDEAKAVAIDKNDNILVAGLSTGNIWVRKYSPAGVALWTRTFLGVQGLGSSAYGITTDKDGNVFVAGSMSTAMVSSNGWIAKISP